MMYRKGMLDHRKTVEFEGVRRVVENVKVSDDRLSKNIKNARNFDTG